jgi:hypothetical protein
VDVVNGNDENFGLTQDQPLKTIQEAIDRIPFFNNDYIYIRVINTGTTWIENLYFRGIIGGGRIGIELGQSNIMKGNIQIYKCMNEINIATIQGSTVSTANTSTLRAQIVAQDDSASDAVIYMSMSNFIYLYDIVLNGNNVCSYGYNSWGCNVKNYYCEAYNCKSAAAYGHDGSKLDINQCAGSNPKGIILSGASHAGGSGRGYASNPAGAEKDLSNGAYCSVTWTYDAGAAKPIYAASKVTTWTNNDNGAWYSQGGWASTDLYQGKRPTDVPIWYGAWFFNTRSFAALKNPDGTNRPITKVRISIARYNGYGDNTARKPHFYYNAATSKGTPSGLLGSFMAAESFTWGQRKWVTLPNSYGEAFRDGKAKTLWLYDGSNTGNYMRMLASATLEITHG